MNFSGFPLDEAGERHSLLYTYVPWLTEKSIQAWLSGVAVSTDFAISFTTTLLISSQCPRWINDDEEGERKGEIFCWYFIVRFYCKLLRLAIKYQRKSASATRNRYFSTYFLVEANICILLIKSLESIGSFFFEIRIRFDVRVKVKKRF